MNFFSQIILAYSLSADAFAMAVTNGICSHKVTKKQTFTTGLIFGALQGLMPLVGFLLCKNFSCIISKYDHYVALFLLLSIGINMIVDTVKEQKQGLSSSGDSYAFSMKSLLLQGIATSIDALAAGVSFMALKVPIIQSSILISVVTFINCSIGVFIGNKFGSLFGHRAKLIGGILIILIGIKIFFERVHIHMN